MTKIISGIHQLRVPIPNNPLGYLNCYLIEGKDGWMMVDTGWYTTDALNSLQAGLSDLGLALTNISTMVVTHVHADHFVLAGRIKQISPKTQLLTHRWESELIESRYVKFDELRDKMSALLLRHGVPHMNLSALDSASMPALEFVTVTTTATLAGPPANLPATALARSIKKSPALVCCKKATKIKNIMRNSVIALMGMPKRPVSSIKKDSIIMCQEIGGP